MRVAHPKVGEIRKRSDFLFWPMRIGFETRWLEWAEWEEVWGWTDTVSNLVSPIAISGIDEPAQQPEPIRYRNANWQRLRWADAKEVA